MHSTGARKGDIMRVRSTGLGKTELTCTADSLKCLKHGYLLMNVMSIEPVQWHIRIVLTYRDIFKIMSVGFFTIIAYAFTGLKTIFFEPPSPEEY